MKQTVLFEQNRKIINLKEKPADGHLKIQTDSQRKNRFILIKIQTILAD